MVVIYTLLLDILTAVWEAHKRSVKLQLVLALFGQVSQHAVLSAERVDLIMWLLTRAHTSHVLVCEKALLVFYEAPLSD